MDAIVIKGAREDEAGCGVLRGRRPARKGTAQEGPCMHNRAGAKAHAWASGHLMSRNER
jgi:hypothetical protein